MEKPPPFRADQFEEVRALCRTHIEAIHNFQFLLKNEVAPDSKAAAYVEGVGRHLDCLTDVLCRPIEN